MSRYRETLHAWAIRHVPYGARVTAVDVDHEEEYADPTYGDVFPGRLEVWISYILGGQHLRSLIEVESLGEILTALFAIEDAEDGK